jgi:hypothetical protein
MVKVLLSKKTTILFDFKESLIRDYLFFQVQFFENLNRY